MMKNHHQRHAPVCLALCLLAITLLAATAAYGQATARPIGWHVVRPGDTLIGLSQLYSGDSRFWRENWALNPDIKNPNFLNPGMRVRVLLGQDVPPESARLIKVLRQVEKKPTPQPWDRAEVDDLLRDRDGLRTGRDGAFEMRFTDGTSMSVGEEALIFLRRLGSQLQGVSRDEIEIVNGQADLAGRTITQPTDIDIIVGSARATPRPDAKGTLQTRIRKAGGGDAQLMVYEGKSAVEAAGATVAVGAGMGTSVAEGKPPTPPEKLLAAPTGLLPTAGSKWDFSNPEFSWNPVTGAASYRVEVCAQPDCLQVLGRYADLTEPRWRPESLPKGQYSWRVNAIAASGLDGFPSQTTAIQIASELPDRQPPSAQLSLSGLYIRYGEDLILGPYSRFETEVFDPQSGVGDWVYLLDGQAVSQQSWHGPWATGGHRAEAIIADRAGNRATLGPFDFVGDPDPPQLDWRTGGSTMVDEGGLPGWDTTPLKRRRIRKLRKSAVILEFSSDGARWLPIRLTAATAAAGDPAAAEHRRVEIGSVAADRARIFLRAPAANPFGADSPVQLGVGEILEVRSEDPGSGVGTLRFGLTHSDADHYQLWFEATDLVGNSRLLELPVMPKASSR